MSSQKIRQPIVTVCGHVDHGKCVAGDTLIPLVDGTLVTARDLFEKNYDKTKAKKEGEDIVQKIKEVTLFSNYGQIILPTKVSHMWKRKKEEMIMIKTAHGDILKTTPEHPYFTFSIKGDRKTRAEDLNIGDYIAIPRKIKIKDTNPKEIILKKLKEHNFLCFLNINSKELIEKIRKKGINKTEKELSVKNLADSLRKARIRFQDLHKICHYLNIPEIKIYEMIDTIKNSSEKQRVGHTSKMIKLPNLHELEKLGYVLGCIAGDGHLSKTQVLLDNNEKEIQEKYSEYLKEIFNMNSFVKQNHTCQTTVNNGGLTFKKFVKEIIGIPDKQKSGTIKVPEIAQKNKEVFRGFFAGMIDTDGYISHINHSIELTSKSKMLIKQCSILLLNLGIQSVVYEKNGFHVLRIANKEYLDKFLENFNLRLKRKLSRIITASKKAQSSRIFNIYPIPKEELKKLNLPKKPNKVIPYFNKYIKSQNLTTNFLKKVLENLKGENQTSYLLKMLLEREVDYVKVISKKKIKNQDEYVYDFTVPDTHNFIAERTLVHNTSILDKLRESSVQESEAGGITQKISFTLYPAKQIKSSCPLIDKSGIKLEIPGFLFIDTPGHAAFTNLRKRGGSLADLAVLVIDINEGIKPQTAEVIQILKRNKTPFLIALNKIDNISSWRTPQKEIGLKENIESQSTNVKQDFNEKYMTLIGSLNSHGFDTDLFYNIEDFQKKIAMVPCSAKTGEGIPELILMLCGLSQRYLKERLSLGKEAKGVVLEIKKERENNYIESILYDGELSKKDEIAVSDFEGNAIISKIRILEEIQALNNKFKPKENVTASTGLRIQLVGKINVAPGMPFVIYKNNKEEIEKTFKKELSENITSLTKKQGIITKADSLGSLEALLVILNENNIPVVKARIGNINKNDVASAKANLEIDELNAVILGFNISMDDDARELIKNQNLNIKILSGEVIYKIIEELIEFRDSKRKEIEKSRFMDLTSLTKLRILPQYVFRNTHPAIFGVKVEAGKAVQGINLIDDKSEKVGRIKNLQAENKSVNEANEGTELAVSIPGINFERKLKDKQFLYSDISESQFKKFKKNKDLLSSSEISLLQEIAEIKRQEKSDWGI